MIQPISQGLSTAVCLKKGQQKSNNKQISFGKALTVAQRKEFGGLVSKMFKKLGINHNIMIIHAPSFPPEFSKALGDFVDTGVGSSCDSTFEKIAKFAKDLFGSTGIQYGPESKLTKTNPSPYSHGAFSMGEHVISPIKLFEEKLISKKTLEIISKESPKTKENIINADYKRFFDNFPKVLDEAYANFKKLDSNHALKKEFENYKNLPQIAPWLEKDAIFSNVLFKEHTTYNIFNWPELDRKLNLYLSNAEHPKYNEAVERLKSIREKHAEEIEKYKFQQFLIHRQKLETKELASKIGQKLIGDVKIGNGINDIWAFPNAFLIDFEKNIRTTIGWKASVDWGVDALDSTKKEAQDFLELKMDNMFLYHDGTRLDAVFGYVAPYLKAKQTVNGKTTELSNKMVIQGDNLLKAIDKSIQKNNINKEFVFSENFSQEQAGMTGRILTSMNIPQLAIETPRYPQTDSINWVVERSHDNPTLINLKNGDSAKIKEKLAEEYTGFDTTAKNAKLNKEFFYLDAFGIRQAHNIPDTIGENWLTRLPKDWEKLYYSNLIEHKGFNMAEILLDAAEKKGITKAQNPNFDKALMEKLQEYKAILQEPGPLTTEEAENALIMASTPKHKNLFAKIGLGIVAGGTAIAVGVKNFLNGSVPPQVAMQIPHIPPLYNQPNQDKKPSVWDSVKST